MMRWILLLACCDGSNLGTPDLSVNLDLASSTDGGAIGGPCAGDNDCHQGATPLCWQRTYLNMAGFVATPGGYCTSLCQDDTDCPNAHCISEGSDGKWCMSECAGAADCRTGFACFTATTNHCFPGGGLTCDPGTGPGTCDGAGSLPGGCIRRALGSGNVGVCFDGCSPGPASCPPSGGSKRQCVVLDLLGDSGGDKFDGPVCVASYSTNAVGSECVSGSRDFIDACIDGAACYLQYLGGDNLCHTMCVPGATDGGTACAGGTTCTDVWNLFAGANPVGLCI